MGDHTLAKRVLNCLARDALVWQKYLMFVMLPDWVAIAYHWTICHPAQILLPLLDMGVPWPSKSHHGAPPLGPVPRSVLQTLVHDAMLAFQQPQIARACCKFGCLDTLVVPQEMSYYMSCVIHASGAVFRVMAALVANPELETGSRFMSCVSADPWHLLLVFNVFIRCPAGFIPAGGINGTGQELCRPGSVLRGSDGIEVIGYHGVSRLSSACQRL